MAKKVISLHCNPCCWSLCLCISRLHRLATGCHSEKGAGCHRHHHGGRTDACAGIEAAAARWAGAMPSPSVEEPGPLSWDSVPGTPDRRLRPRRPARAVRRRSAVLWLGLAVPAEMTTKPPGWVHGAAAARDVRSRWPQRPAGRTDGHGVACGPPELGGQSGRGPWAHVRRRPVT